MVLSKHISKSHLEDLKSQIEEVFQKLGYRVVTDQGDFKEGTCVVHKEKTIVLNRYTPLDLQVEFLLKVLYNMDLSNVYIKPEIRQYLDKMNILF